MTDPNNTPVQVEVKNWPKPPEPLLIKKTSVKTYVVDPAATNVGTSRWVQICDYEPSRVQMRIQVFDFAVALCTEVPVTSPDPNTAAGSAPQGRYLPASLNVEYPLYGPDAFYINPITGGAARVTVTREYC